MSFERHFRLLDDWLQVHNNIVVGILVAAGFIARLREATGTFLNPDEAMHFMVANRDSLKLAYQASLNLAHPPLLIFILYFLRGFGSSELVLRSPSILAGTAFCWVGFKWLGTLFDRTTSLIGLIFFALLPSTIGLSREVRQYALLLLFCASAGYFLEKALADNSARFMIASAVSVYLAMLSHYSAFIFAAALGGYAILRMIKGHPNAGLLRAWLVGQFGSLGIAVFLYKTQLSKLGAVGTGVSSEGQDFYLRNSYFDSSHINALHFMFARTGGVFQYIFSQLAVGDLAVLFFLIGTVILWRGRFVANFRSGESRIRGWVVAILLTLPFVITCVAALTGKYPYGGTRHDSFLIPFAIAGVSIAVVRLMRRRLFSAAAAAVVIVAICNLFPSHRQPYIAREDQSKAEMSESVKFIRSEISSSDLIFSDFQSRLLLGHYLCDQKIVSYDKSIPKFISAECGGVHMIATTANTFVFSPKTFLQNWSDMVVAFGLKPGERVWVVQEGWNVHLSDELRKAQEWRNLNVHFFGHNIAIFPLTVGQAVPNFAGLANGENYFSPSAFNVTSSGIVLPLFLVTTPKPPL